LVLFVLFVHLVLFVEASLNLHQTCINYLCHSLCHSFWYFLDHYRFHLIWLILIWLELTQFNSTQLLIHILRYCSPLLCVFDFNHSHIYFLCSNHDHGLFTVNDDQLMIPWWCLVRELSKCLKWYDMKWYDKKWLIGSMFDSSKYMIAKWWKFWTEKVVFYWKIDGFPIKFRKDIIFIENDKVIWPFKNMWNRYCGDFCWDEHIAIVEC
jgi:hypothetical protein